MERLGARVFVSVFWKALGIRDIGTRYLGEMAQISNSISQIITKWQMLYVPKMRISPNQDLNRIA